MRPSPLKSANATPEFLGAWNPARRFRSSIAGWLILVIKRSSQASSTKPLIGRIESLWADDARGDVERVDRRTVGVTATAAFDRRDHHC
jgi:hypothetical protein